MPKKSCFSIFVNYRTVLRWPRIQILIRNDLKVGSGSGLNYSDP
jgi:hypothetical protein